MLPETLQSERRERSRQRPLSLVYVELAMQNGGMMRDISDEGFAARVMMPLRVGDKTPFSFSLNEFIHIEGEGLVLWVAEKGRVAGLKFTQITPAARAQIHGWLNGGDAAPKKAIEEKTVAAEAPTLEQLREELRASPPRPQTVKPSQKPAPASAVEVAPAQVEAVTSTPVISGPAEARKPEPQVEMAARREEESAPVEAAPLAPEVASAPAVTEAPPELEAAGLKSEAETVATEPESLPAEPEPSGPTPAEVVASAPVVVERGSQEVAESEPVAESQLHQAEALRTLTDQIASAVPAVMASVPTAAECPKPAEAQPSTEFAGQMHAESVAAPAAQPAPSAPDGIANALTIGETPAEKIAESQSGSHEQETVNVASLFTPVSDVQADEKHAAPAAPIWRADGQMQPSASGAAQTAPAMAANAPAAAETQCTSESKGGGASGSTSAESAPADMRPKLPRLALRLNAEDYVKQRFPFAVGPLPPPEPEPASEQRPKRFWAPVPPAPAEEQVAPSQQPTTPVARDMTAAKRDVMPGPRGETPVARESRPDAREEIREKQWAPWTLPPTAAQPSVRQKTEEPQSEGSILPDISSILIQPSAATQHAPAGDPSVLDTLRPWHHQPEKTKGHWAGRFTLPRAVGVMILLVLLVALYAYRHDAGLGLIWLGEQIGGKNGQSQQPEVSQSTPPSPIGRADAPADSSSSPATPEPKAASEAAPPNDNRANDGRGNEGRDSQSQKSAQSGPGTASATRQSAKPKNVPPPVTPPAGNLPSTLPEPTTEAGQAEYQEAMQILRGKNQGYALAEAVRLLWAAVEKGNPSAELALADMYWHGKGVARNCDQTRILLTAASRKGSAEAQKRLQEFQQEGCE